MKRFLWLLVLLPLMGAQQTCDGQSTTPVSTTGVQKATAKVEVQASGLTMEQENIQRRLEEDNKPGSLKHLYIISAFSGDVILYSTVRGKVTSSGKRLTPYAVAALQGQYVGEAHNGIPIDVGGRTKYTAEVLQDDGTYGSSVEYIYWWDSKGVYHQHYVTGGQIVHVASAPMRVGKIIINIETGETK